MAQNDVSKRTQNIFETKTVSNLKSYLNASGVTSSGERKAELVILTNRVEKIQLKVDVTAQDA